ncbi:hypothetical protein BOQ62_17775 [Chryseobacterium sp. CH21]|uniref:lantibiotic dehydratase n=1 Tax=Chryseobacterium sp. CH21 TaxID=713556 RepID=UPI00100B0AA7|nr:lantibiotic dehydratase [Chryseobacterium sp. CH21]RXM38412.1 hypothetical protein BOQ62_17775 [Chryseobacterium sp. CH21]
MSLNILPYIFTRFAALPVQSLNTLVIPDAQHQLETWQKITELQKISNENLCDQLYLLIEKSTDNLQQKQLLNLKRSIYNSRQNALTLIEKIQPETFELFKEYWHEWQHANATYKEFLELWEVKFQNYQSSSRQEIQKLIGEYPFKNGVLLSSKDLYEQLDGFALMPATPNKYSERIEFSILRYLTRMTYKTSPFSTFTYLGLTKTESDNSSKPSSLPTILNCKIRLNNKLLKRIKKLMEQHPALQNLLLVNTNSSIAETEDRFTFLMNCANIEVFQEIQASGINQYIKELIDHSEESLPLSSLAKLLSSQIDAALPELQNYLLKLVDVGFLELTLECSEIDPDWDSHLLIFLGKHKEINPSAHQLHQLVLILHEAKKEFGTAEISHREALLRKTSEIFDRVISDLENQAGIVKLPKEEMQTLVDDILQRYKNGEGFEKLPYLPTDYRQEGFIYEDVYTTATHIIDKTLIQEYGQLLSDLSNRLSAFDIRGNEKNSMTDFFRSRYDHNQYIPLVTFYHEYYRYKNENESKPDIIQKDIENSWADTFWENLHHKLENPDEIKICQKNLDVLPISKHQAPAGSAFIQLADDSSGGKAKAVVNGLMQGMGKMSGRFLHLFDDEVSETHRDYNNRLFPDQILIELNDDSSFNANIHPPLLDHEVKMPSSNTQMKKSQQIPLNQISVGYHSDNNSLCLIETFSRKEIYAFDLCLETITNRSNLYQLMSLFNPCIYVSYHPLIQIIDRNFSKQYNKMPIQIFPRIVYEDLLILRRKGWLINLAAIPVQGKDEGDGIYFLRFNLWLSENGLPSSLFLYLQSSYIPEDDSVDQPTGYRDDYKPQFIDFRQPLLFNLFKKLLKRASSYIYVEETLPTVDNSRNRVAEHLIQWYNF